MEDEPLPPGYPAEWEADVVLRDGTVAHVRPICPSDGDGIRRFHAAQSDESIYLRFFAPLRQLSDSDVFRFTHVDYADRVALVATMREEIIGIGRYDRIDARTASCPSTGTPKNRAPRPASCAPSSITIAAMATSVSQ